MIDEQQNPWKINNKETVYENKWIRVTHHDVTTPHQTQGIYGTVHFKNYAIGIVPIDEEGYTYLVGQYRFAIQAYSWEIPEGGGLIEDDILEAARRELQEETGLVAEQWLQFAILHTSNSATDEKAFLFLAQKLKHVQMQPDETEQLQIRRVKIETAIEMALRGELTDAISVAALLKLKILLERKEIIL